MKHQLFSRWNRGLMPAVFLALFVLTTAVFVGCEQEPPVSAGMEQEIDQAQALPELDALKKLIVPATTQYFYRDHLYTRDEFEKLQHDSKAKHTMTVVERPDRHVVYGFDSEEALFAWAATTEFAQKFSEVKKSLGEAKQNLMDEVNTSAQGLSSNNREEASSVVLENLILLGDRDANQSFGKIWTAGTTLRVPQLAWARDDVESLQRGRNVYENFDNKADSFAGWKTIRDHTVVVFYNAAGYDGASKTWGFPPQRGSIGGTPVWYFGDSDLSNDFLTNGQRADNKASSFKVF